MASPPMSPQRPASAIIRPARSSSRLSMSSRPGGSRASDEDSKTAVKVAIRVRPALRPCDPGYDLIPQRFQKTAVQVMSPTSMAVDSPQGKKIFVFDKVFSEQMGQAEIWDYLQDSVSAFVSGYNVSLLAYGQSGAGKSYTMGTADSKGLDPANIGIIPRAAVSLFELLGAAPSPSLGRPQTSGIKAPSRLSMMAPPPPKNVNKSWSLKATYVEIYNEQLRDLLIQDTRMEDRPQVTIREDKSGRILLTGLHEMEINTYDDLMGALAFGSSIRQTDATAVNAKSSRSHAVFSLNLVQKKPRQASDKDKRQSLPLNSVAEGSEAGFITVDSKFHFVDLAGSERLKNTMAQGERAKEGISINAGLASLGKVISQLSSRHPGAHVSYRDSKLTRLLQDSLGGSAVTYMVACVTPAEFYLSETLNTVQYAQRARAIQSKPRIQQVSEEGDMKALIERLRAEIAFLREQLRNSNSSDTSERARKVTQDRPDRSNEKEMELQNALLDLQENYSALNQRHARLISELSKARESEAMQASADSSISAVGRLKRSNTFAEAVEVVVMEYEKTIQSLENSLSNTRSSLSTTESSLLEKETKLAYVETINQQLQARLQKMMDRENNTETYLVDLESKLLGHTTGDEKNTAIISELRKEIARVKENESACEDYISTLEDRLAESDHDLELMTREIARLEHMVERQRNLNKLENMLSEFGPSAEEKSTNGDSKSEFDNVSDSGSSVKMNGRMRATSFLNSSQETIEEETDSQSGSIRNGETTSKQRRASRAAELAHVTVNGKSLTPENYIQPQSPAQTEFVHDKFETVQQELFELKVEHESTVNEFEQMSSNYETALRDLARLQDELDELRLGKSVTPGSNSPPPSPSPMRPVSFLAGTRVSELKGEELTGFSSRSLSSELSSATDLPSTESNEAETEAIRQQLTALRNAQQQHQEKEAALAAEMEAIKRDHEEKQERITALQRERDRIQSEHQEALHLVEELKQDVAKVRSQTSITANLASHLIRRKSNQSLMMLDRAQRSFNSLRKIASPYLETHPESAENFESNLEEALQELQVRSDRIQELENEITGLRRDLENKSTMITGLTRERSSKTSSPMDISVVAVMERRIEEAEHEVQYLRQQLSDKEESHRSEIEKLREQLLDSVNEAKTHVTALLEAQTKISESTSLNEQQSQKIIQLQKYMLETEASHKSTIDSMATTEQKLLQTISDLETSIKELESAQLDAANKAAAELERVRSDFEDEKTKQQEVVDSLQSVIEEHKATIDAHKVRIGELEHASAAAQRQLETRLADVSAAEESSRSEVRKHRDTIALINSEVASKMKMVADYESQLDKLQSSLDAALEEVKSWQEKEAAAQAALKESEEKIAEMTLEAVARQNDLDTIKNSHDAELAAIKETYEQRLSATREILDESNKTAETQVRKVQMLERNLLDAQNTIEALERDRDANAHNHIDTTEANEIMKLELAQAKKQIEKQLQSLKELQDLHKEAQSEIEKLTKKEEDHSRVIEELEQQLTFTFDQNQESTKRLADVTAEIEHIREERNALLEAQSKRGEATEALNGEVVALKAQLADVQNELSNHKRAERSNSTSGSKDLRKSASAASLPSPPPIIPLPPLPLGGTASPTSAATPSSPNMSRRPSKDYVATHIDDQEARIKTLEKQLLVEKALTQTLEEALTDCERTMKRLTADRESLQLKAQQVQEELERTKNESQSSRYSMQAVEDERQARMKAEQARAQLEQRMEALNRKSKRSFACF